LRACNPPESWGICCLPAIFKFIAMAKVRGFAKQQLDAFCQLYSVARRDGCTVQEKCQPGKRWGIKREKAMQFEALLAGSSELQEATLEPARVREVLEPLLAQQPVRETPTEEAAALPSFPERIADAMLELRRDRLKRGIVGVLAKKYEISERSILRYRKELKFELERDPPIIEEVFRMLVRRKAEERDKRQRGHTRYFGDFEEQMLVGTLLGLDQSSQPMTQPGFCAFVRGILLRKFEHDPVRRQEVATSDLRKWLWDFRQRHALQLSFRKTQFLSVERASAHDCEALDRWFEGVSQLERSWIEKGLLPSTGLQKIQTRPTANTLCTSTTRSRKKNARHLQSSGNGANTT
jgi:hypothetical protein